MAASGEKQGLRPAIALAILAWVIVGAFVGVLLQERNVKRTGIRAGKSPAVLAEQSRDFLEKSSYAMSAVSASGFRTEQVIAGYATAPENHAGPLGVRSAQFWYRESPTALTPRRAGGASGVDFDDPPLQAPGETRVVLDTQGRLWSMQAVPQPDAPSTATAATDWALLFSAAGLDYSKWTPTDSQTAPIFFADERRAWNGTLPELPDVPVRIEAAAYRGRPVSLEIIGPWDGFIRNAEAGLLVTQGFFGIFLAALIGGSLFFVRQNLRFGRGDRRGATWLAFANLCSMTAYWILRAHHLSRPLDELELLISFAGIGLVYSTILWAFYIAIEPFVRRRWPTILVSWTRLLSGEWRDSLVGRDVLIGCGAAMVTVIIERLSLQTTFSIFVTITRQLNNAMGVGWFASSVIRTVGEDTLSTLGILCLLCFLRALLRSDKIATSVVILFSSLTVFVVPGVLGGADRWFMFLGALLVGAITVFVLLQYGFVAFAVFWIVDDLYFAFQ